MLLGSIQDNAGPGALQRSSTWVWAIFLLGCVLDRDTKWDKRYLTLCGQKYVEQIFWKDFYSSTEYLAKH